VKGKATKKKDIKAMKSLRQKKEVNYMVIAVIATGPIITLTQYVWNFVSFSGSFVLNVLGLFLPY
jgi:hypothetical protein